jgi:hypothetical protein
VLLCLLRHGVLLRALCHAASRCVMLCHAVLMPCCADVMLCHAVSCCADVMPCHAVLMSCCVMLCCQGP